MLVYQSYRKELLTIRYKRISDVNSILGSLCELDPDAEPLALQEAWISRQISVKLWDSVPGEHHAYSFDSETLLAEYGALVLPKDTSERITLHFGYGVLAIRTTLYAAWHGWPRFCNVNVDAYNTCIYPDSLRWYIVRAGTNLYPMRCDEGAKPVLEEHRLGRGGSGINRPAR